MIGGSWSASTLLRQSWEKEFQWSVEIPLLSTTLPSPKVRKRDLREKKSEENHFSAEREPDIHTPRLFS